MDLILIKEASGDSYAIYILEIKSCRLWVEKNGNISFLVSTEAMVDGSEITP